VAKRSRRRSLGPRLAVTFNVALVVALLTAVGGLGFLWVRLDQIPRLDLSDSLDEAPSAGDGQNYLLVGTDSAEGLDPDDPVTNGREGLGILSDTIMLLRVDPDSGQAHLLSLPRDLYVSIPGSGDGKINSALAQGGQDALVSTVQDTLGVEVHHYVQVDFLGFKQLVDAIDGVPFYFATPVRDPSTGLFVGRAGCTTLGPDQALAYARSRHLESLQEGEWQTDPTADLGRISRQQDFIRTAIRQAVVEGIANPLLLGDLLDVSAEAMQIDSDLSVGDAVALGRQFRGFNDDTLQTLTLDVTNDSVDGQSIVRIDDTEANDRKIAIFQGVGGAGSQAAPDISVVVHNGTGNDGEAGEASEGLAALGFDTSPGTGEAENFDFGQTVVRYEAGDEAIARFVAAQFDSGAEVEEVATIDGADLEVVTGDDFDGVSDDLEPPPLPLGTTPGGGGGGGGPVGQVPTREPPPQADC
jgi:LCP family protein required for cell wall assembly